MRVNVPRLYRATLVLFGVSLAANALDSIRAGGPAASDVFLAGAAGTVTLAALLTRDPERHGIPTETGPWFYLVVLGSLLTVAGTALSLL